MELLLRFLGNGWFLMFLVVGVCIALYIAVKKPLQRVASSMSKRSKESDHIHSQARTQHIAQALIASLVDKNIEILGHELKALIGMGESAVEPLISALKHSSSKVRWIAARALGEIKDTRSIEPLIKASVDNDSLVRLTITNILTGIDDLRVIEALVARLTDKDYLVSHSALTPFADGKIKHSLAVEPIMKFLTDKDLEVRKNALKALGKIGDPRALSSIASLINDPDLTIQEHVVWALKELGDMRAIPTLTNTLYHEASYLRIE